MIVHAPEVKRIVVDGSDVDFEISEPLRQPSLTLEVTRESQVYLSHIHPLKATLTDYSYEPTRRLVLHGIRPGLDEDEISLRYDSMMIDRPDELRVLTDITCDLRQPIVFVQILPKSVAVNEEAALSPEAFVEPQDRGKKNIQNCLYLEGAPYKPGSLQSTRDEFDYR